MMQFFRAPQDCLVDMGSDKDPWKVVDVGLEKSDRYWCHEMIGTSSTMSPQFLFPVSLNSESGLIPPNGTP